MTNAAGAPFRFTIRLLLAATAGVAFVVAAAAALPTRWGAISLIVVTLSLPGALIIAGIAGDGGRRAFCLAAVVPIVFGLYGIAWGFGWTIYNAAEPLQVLGWFESNGRAIKAVALGSWMAAVFAGLVGWGVQRVVK